MRFRCCPLSCCCVLVAVCAGMALLTGCSSRNDAAPVKPRPLLVDGGAKSKPPAGVPKTNRHSRPDIRVELYTPEGNAARHSVTIKWAVKSGTKMTCSARSADFNEVTQVGTLVDFSAQLYENGRLTASVRAPRAVADAANRVIVASGGVVLKSLERATVVRAEWIKWDALSDRVTGNGGVSVESTNGSLHGTRITADTALKTIKVE